MIRLIVALFLLWVGPLWSMEVRLTASEFPPYCGETLEGNGIAINMVREALRQEGHNLTVDFRPWSRAYKEAQFGESDGILCLWYTQERATWFDYSSPLLQNEIGFFSMSDNVPHYPFDYKWLILGNVRGYALPGPLESLVTNMTLAVDDRKLLALLIRRRIDLAVIDYGVAQYLLQRDFPKHQQDVVWLGKPLERKYLHVGLSKQRKGDAKSKSPRSVMIRDAINAGLEKMRKSGQWAKFLSVYGLRVPELGSQDLDSEISLPDLKSKTN